MAFADSVASYPNRGPYGDSLFRGNVSGYLIKDLIETYQPGFVYDPMHGGGTTGEVCEHLKVPWYATDIRKGGDVMKKVVRQGVQHELPDAGVDLIFWHPPYWNMIGYTHDENDLSQAPTYDSFLARSEDILKWLATLLSTDGRIALLLADLRLKRSTRTYFLTDDLTAEHRMVRCKLEKQLRIIKIQHKTMSNGHVGLEIPMIHEYLTIMGNRR
jgi:hypothetical protein